jgi:hypothetical protein
MNFGRRNYPYRRVHDLVENDWTLEIRSKQKARNYADLNKRLEN